MGGDQVTEEQPPERDRYPCRTDLRRTRIFLDCVDVTRSSCLKTRPGNPPQTEHLPSSDREFPCLNTGWALWTGPSCRPERPVCSRDAGAPELVFRTGAVVMGPVTGASHGDCRSWKVGGGRELQAEAEVREWVLRCVSLTCSQLTSLGTLMHSFTGKHQ